MEILKKTAAHPPGRREHACSGPKYRPEIYISYEIVYI